MSKRSLATQKKNARNIAVELNYSKEIIKQIMAATTEGQIDRLMKVGRMKIPEYKPKAALNGKG